MEERRRAEAPGFDPADATSPAPDAKETGPRTTDGPDAPNQTRNEPRLTEADYHPIHYQAWIDDHMSWRPRGQPDRYDGFGEHDTPPDGTNGRCIVDYDPLEGF